ncbi:MAG: type II toxin-antitoxin system RelE/ParE family toxin [Blastocatellia bacterium]
MLKVIRSPEAAEDLLEIWQYTADDNEAAADKLLDEIDRASKMLARNPQAGRDRPELAPRLRSFPVGRYILFYRPIDDGVEIVRVLHGSRDIDSIFGF